MPGSRAGGFKAHGQSELARKKVDENNVNHFLIGKKKVRGTRPMSKDNLGADAGGLGSGVWGLGFGV